MRLKKIELQGFKSFANKTDIEFLDGITTIVGPNGSGKSNVSDAVRWVLGEQSTKALRSSKMEDIIFSGTENRKKVGFASVLLTLDNTDNTLPVDYNEVVIGRRIFRSGESSYLINGSECRLKDISELFLDTGIGKDGYSIVGQGKIDEVLSSKSEDRRAIFEEASGIMKYRVKKEEASRKLISAENNLSRVNDILIEIESNIIPLEEKAKKAKEYLNYRDRLKILDVNIFLESIKENATKLANLDEKIEILNNDIKLEEMDSINLEKAKINLKQRLEELQLSIEQSQKKYFETQTDLEKLNSKVTVIESNVLNNNSNISRLIMEKDESIKNIDVIKEEIEKKKSKKEDLLENKVKFENELKNKEESLRLLNEKLNSKDKEVEDVKNKYNEILECINENNILKSSFEATIIANEKQLENLNKVNTNSFYEKDKLTFAKEDVVKSLNKYKVDLSNINKEIEENEKTLKGYLKQNDDVINKSNKLKSQIMALTSKYAYLTNLERENEGYFKSVKSILDYTDKNKIDGVFGTVSSAISADEKYERAIEVALGTFIQNIIVENENKAKSLIEYLKENLLGRATFLPLTKINDIKDRDIKYLLKEEGVLGLAKDLCTYDKKFDKIINLTLGNIIVVENLDVANKIFMLSSKSVKIVTLSGELVSLSGAITGGHTSIKTSGILGREEKIKRLEASVLAKENEYEVLEGEIEEISPKIVNIQNILKGLKIKLDEVNINIATFNEKLNNINNEFVRHEVSINKFKESKENLNNDILKLKESIEKIVSDNLIYTKECDEKNVVINEYNKDNLSLSKELDFLNEDIVNLKISCASFTESELSFNEIEEKLLLDISNFENLNLKKSEEIEKLKGEIKNFNKEKDNTILEKENLEKFKVEYNELSLKLKEDKVEINKKLDTLEVEVLASINKISKLKDEVNKIASRKIKFELDIDTFKNDMWDNYEITLSLAKEFSLNNPVDLDISSIVKEAQKLRDNIKKLGDVDVNSIEEFNTLKERYDFIISQKTDLDETKKKLENLINNMTSIMKSEFASKFKIINENFKKAFNELFGGGKASLKLVDENNILESGIEIEAMPPGKKLGCMTLLSGGERALTAIALLFAIMKIKAPPFCILDEIEAALDDINVIRFAEYIKNYSDDTQFIVITHRKGTMEVANTVYGVTMEEHGVSKLISMKLNSENSK